MENRDEPRFIIFSHFFLYFCILLIFLFILVTFLHTALPFYSFYKKYAQILFLITFAYFSHFYLLTVPNLFLIFFCLCSQRLDLLREDLHRSSHDPCISRLAGFVQRTRQRTKVYILCRLLT